MVSYNLPSYEKQLEILNATNEIKNVVGDPNANSGKTFKRQVFTENGIWTAPVGVTTIFVTGGGGGGGGALFQATAYEGGSGGITSFGDKLSLSGGGGGSASASNAYAYGGAPGGSGGEPGGVLIMGGVNSMVVDSNGGSCGFFRGGKSHTGLNSTTHLPKNGGYCCGGGAAVSTSGAGAGAGGSGDFVISYPIEVVPGTQYEISIGLGGAAAQSPNTPNARGGDGGNGILIIDWWG